MTNLALWTEGSRPYGSSIAYGHYPSKINDGVRDFSGDTDRDSAWSSASEKLPQWAAVVFRLPAVVHRAAVYWGRSGSFATSRRFRIEVWIEDGWTTVSCLEQPEPTRTTEVAFKPVTCEAIRLCQDAGDGPKATPYVMHIAELEAWGTFADHPPVDILRIRDALREEWERNYGEMRAEITREVLDRIDRSGKGRPRTGPIGSAEIERARRNIEGFPWGRSVSQKILSDADWWLSKDDQFVYDVIPADNPKAISPSYERGCPIHGGGRKCMRTNTALKYRWQCIEGGEWWYDGAQVRNPATGETVEVRDDGDGWIAPPGFLHPGTIYHFRSAWRYYVLSKLFYTPYELTIEAEDAYTGKTAITRLTHAFAISGDVRYAHKAAIMLNRLAEVYRFYTGTVDEQRPLTRGYLVQVSFEEWPIHNCLVAYDVLMDVMLQDRELLDFFARKGDCDYNGDGKVDFADVRYNIQHNLFGYMYEWLHRAMAIQTGDYVLREGLVLAAMGAILDNRELIDEAMDGPFGLATNLTNNMFRDGKWWYDSPGYAVSSVTSLIMERLFSLRHLRLVDDPRLRIGQAVGFVRGVDCDGRLPAIGDTGGADSRTKVLNPYSMCALEETAYTHTGERGCLDRLLALSGGDVDLMRDRYASVELLFYAEPIRGEAGALENGTVLFHDSGFAILRTGTELDTRKHIVLNYGKGNSGHGHHDKLAVNLIAYGYDLAADLGYPTTFTHRKVAGWETHTASHATVCIDGRNQELATGSLRLFGKTPGTQVICATGERAYPDLAEVYERTLSVIDVSDSQAYVFDVFRVRGGNVHDYLFRSLSGEAGSNFCVDHPEGVEIVPQAVGTLAGEAVAFGEMPGYGFVKDVTRATCEGVSNATWRIGNEDDTGIRLTMLGGKGMQIITGKGEGYGFFGKSPWDACFAARAVSVGETTVFTAILQPFQLRPFIKAVQPISVAGGVGAKIVLEGREDYLFRKVGNVPFCISDIDGKRVELDGEFARVSIWPRGKRELHLIQGRRLRFGDAVLEAPAIPRARIESVDPAAKTIVIVLDSGESVSDGDTIIVTNPASICTSSFEVRNADPVGERRYRLEVSMGLTLCEGVVSVVDRNEGTFQTEASLTKLKACPGLFDGKAVWVNGTRLGVVLSAAPPVFKMTDRSAVSNMVVGDSFLVSDLDTGDELEVMRSAHKTIVVADSEDLRQG